MRCIECEQQINNPICPECLSEGIMALVGEKAGRFAADAVWDITKALRYDFGTTNCIKCNKIMGVCAHCYTNELFSILSEHPTIMAQIVYYLDIKRAPVTL